MNFKSVSSSELAEVRHLEAVGFRSWPSTNTIFDGTWAIRLTAGHPAKRLNSINPLDRGDIVNLETRITRAARRFQSFGRPLIFRQSPLAPPRLETMLEDYGWESFDETQVMTASLDAMDFSQTIDHLPMQDVGRWIDQCIAMDSFSSDLKPGMSELISSVEGEVGLFLMESDNHEPLSAAMVVRFGRLAGLFEIVSNPELRGRGYGRSIVKVAMQWARNLGSTKAWLQVVADNIAARSLYESLGFEEQYRYAYRQAPQEFRG